MEKKQKKGFMDWYFTSNLLARILIGLVLGVIAGLIVGPKIVVIKSFGTPFLDLLLMVVVPLIFFSILARAASLSLARSGRVTTKILLHYILTTVFAATIGLLLEQHIFHPGLELSLVKAGAHLKVTPLLSMTNPLLDMVPKSPVATLAESKVLPTIFFAIIFGVAIAFLKKTKNNYKSRRGTELREIEVKTKTARIVGGMG